MLKYIFPRHDKTYHGRPNEDIIPNVDENGDPIYKIDSEPKTEKLPEIGELSNTAHESEFKDTPQDLKDTTSQE